MTVVGAPTSFGTVSLRTVPLSVVLTTRLLFVGDPCDRAAAMCAHSDLCPPDFQCTRWHATEQYSNMWHWLQRLPPP